MKQIGHTQLYIVNEKEIQVKNRHSTHPRSVCPVCSESREHPNDPSVAWNFTLGLGYCHHCHSTFKIDNTTQDFQDKYITSCKIKNTHPQGSIEASENFRSHLLPLDETSIAYLAQRGISAETAQAAGVCTRKSWRSSFWESWLAFPYFRGKRIVNVQYKFADISDKRFFMEPGGEIIPWNIGCIDEDRGWEPLYITEGMIDALALMECGCSYVVSVPNGAECKMSCFARYRDKIYKKFRYIVFAGDTDAEGLKLRDRVIAFFSKTDVVAVEWLYGVTAAKDADEMLMARGKEGVRAALNDAETFDSDYVIVAGEDESGIRELYRNGIPKGLGIGLQGFDDIVHFEPGNLLLVTGYPGAGKSTLVNFIVTRLLCMYGWRTLFFSPEKQPDHYHEEEIISILSGKRFDNSVLTEREFEHTLHLLGQNVIFIKEEISNLDLIIRITERMLRVRDIRVLVIDPFVYLDMPQTNASETQKIAEMLKKIVVATRRMNLVTILVAHPRKPSLDGPVEPSLYEVAGSANFYNFCDAGIILERVKGSRNLVKVTCGKARRPFNGCIGECRLAYDVSCGRYISCNRDMAGNYTNDYGAFDNDCYEFEFSSGLAKSAYLDAERAAGASSDSSSDCSDSSDSSDDDSDSSDSSASDSSSSDDSSDGSDDVLVGDSDGGCKGPSSGGVATEGEFDFGDSGSSVYIDPNEV